MTNVLMCGSALSIKGGMVSVVNNYLNYKDWKDVKISYIPTHINAHKYILILYFMWAYIKILCLTLAGKVDIVHKIVQTLPHDDASQSRFLKN